MLDAAGEVALAVAFAYAGATKFYDRESFAAVLRAGGIRHAGAASAAVPVAEVAVAIGLVVGTPTTQRVALAAALALLGAFSAWLANLHRRRLRVPCRCFGSDAATGVGAGLARNAVMAAVAAACLLADGPLPLEPSTAAVLTVGGSVVLLWAAYGVVLAWPALLKRVPDEATG
jgi:uncharacterized membrane protein YphA (DoxX/SURF4 family)